MHSRLAASVLLLALGAACGGSSPASPSPVATPTPAPVATVVLEGSLPDMEPMWLFTVGQFTTSTVGRIEITVDWTLAENDVDFYLTQSACSIEAINAGACSFVAYSVSKTAKPETTFVENAPPGTYALLIGNRGPTKESVSYQVVFKH